MLGRAFTASEDTEIRTQRRSWKLLGTRVGTVWNVVGIKVSSGVFSVGNNGMAPSLRMN